MEALWKTITEYAVTAGVRLVTALLVLVIGWRLIRLLIQHLSKGRGFRRLDEGAQSFLKSLLSILLRVILILTVAAMLGIPMTNMVAVLGSAGLALGLALQGSLSNFAGGLMLLLFKPFRVGDYIDTHTDSGTVEEITIFYTTLITPDNRKVIIPNGSLSNATLVNYSTEPVRRVDLTFSAAYSSDLDTVKQALLRVASAHELVLKEPEPFARLQQQEDSALIFVLRAFCKSEDYWTVYFDLQEAVKREFDRLGIEIPFPQLDVHQR